MDRESVERLRHDKRLNRRREWVSADVRQSYVDSLPDLTDKMVRGSEEEEQEAAAEGSGAEAAPSAGQSFPDPAAATPQSPPTPIPFGSSVTPSRDFSNDGGEGGSGF